MLVEIAVGDAYGAGFEYVPHRIVQEYNDLSAYRQHPRHALIPGCYTDDTQMSIAVAEAMLHDAEWTPESLAQRFVRAFKRDPREGYSTRLYGLLLQVNDGRELLRRVDSNSDRSGAAMRAGVIGLYPSVDEVRRRCTLQASLTHNTPDGIRAANAAALMTHYFRHRLGPKHDLATFLRDELPGAWPVPWRGEVRHQGMMSAAAAVTAILASDRLSELLRACVAFHGDVDTVAAIAMCAGSCSAEVEADLPAVLLTGLERGPYGFEYLAELDRRLEFWARRSPHAGAVVNSPGREPWEDA